MVKIENIYKKYGSKIVLNDITYTFEKGKITTIIAPNGYGKTTLLSIISGLLLPDSGKVYLAEGYDLKDVSIILSGEKNLYIKNTVIENLYYFGIICGMSKCEIKKQINKYCNYFPMYDDIKNNLVESLSYGQKRLVAIFSALISNASCILMDEASEGLDMEYVNILEKILIELSSERVLILASHDYDFVSNVSDEIVFLKNGKFTLIKEKLSLDDLKKNYIQIYDIKTEEKNGDI